MHGPGKQIDKQEMERKSSSSQVSRDVKLVHGLNDELNLLALKLEDPPAFEVAAAERRARDDIPCQVLHLRPHIHLARLSICNQAFPPPHQIRAARGESR